jgi:tetratricopeptide (TPR) repeat protein
LGNAYSSQGDYVKAIDYQEQSLAIKRAISDRNGEANSWFNLGITLSNLNRIPDAMGRIAMPVSFIRIWGWRLGCINATMLFIIYRPS